LGDRYGPLSQKEMPDGCRVVIGFSKAGVKRLLEVLDEDNKLDRCLHDHIERVLELAESEWCRKHIV